MRSAKVAIIGAGKVGISAAFTLLLRETAEKLILYNRNKQKLIGEQLDFQHSLAFLSSTDIAITDTFEDLKDSDVVVYTAGAAQLPRESRLDLTRKNAEIISQTIPEIVRYAPNAVILMVTNPVDVMTYKAWKVSGLPLGKILGSGTTLDTARFRFHLSECLHVSPKNIHTYILGEHGDSSFPILETGNVGGQLFSTMPELPPDTIKDAYQKTKEAANKIIESKGATYYAIGVVINQLVKAILHDTKYVFPVSVPLEGKYGLDGVAMSVPCVLGRNGVERVLEISLSDEEKQKLHHSAEVLKEYLAE